jgi:cephalosporin hydroxylase
MAQSRPQHTLEVGFAFGASCVTFASMHHSLDPTHCLGHIAIDPYQTAVWDNVGNLKLVEAELSRYVDVIEEPSSVALPRLLREGRHFGMIYVDGSHLVEDVFVDAYYCMRLLDEGGYLLFDDSTDRHVAKVLHFINTSIPGLKRQPEVSLKQAVARFIGKRQLTVYRRVGNVERAWDSAFRQF